MEKRHFLVKKEGNSFVAECSIRPKEEPDKVITQKLENSERDLRVFLDSLLITNGVPLLTLNKSNKITGICYDVKFSGKTPIDYEIVDIDIEFTDEILEDEKSMETIREVAELYSNPNNFKSWKVAGMCPQCKQGSVNDVTYTFGELMSCIETQRSYKLMIIDLVKHYSETGNIRRQKSDGSSYTDKEICDLYECLNRSLLIINSMNYKQKRLASFLNRVANSNGFGALVVALFFAMLLLAPFVSIASACATFAFLCTSLISNFNNFETTMEKIDTKMYFKITDVFFREYSDVILKDHPMIKYLDELIDKCYQKELQGEVETLKGAKDEVLASLKKDSTDNHAKAVRIAMNIEINEFLSPDENLVEYLKSRMQLLGDYEEDRIISVILDDIKELEKYPYEGCEQDIKDLLLLAIDRIIALSSKIRFGNLYSEISRIEKRIRDSKDQSLGIMADSSIESSLSFLSEIDTGLQEVQKTLGLLPVDKDHN